MSVIFIKQSESRSPLLIRAEPLGLGVGEDQAPRQQRREIAHDLDGDLRVELAIVGNPVQRQLKASHRGIGPDVGAPFLLDHRVIVQQPRDLAIAVSSRPSPMQREHERLGHRLNRERHGAVADLVDMAFDGDERDAEIRRVGSLQDGNIIGDRAGIVALILRNSWSGSAAAAVDGISAGPGVGGGRQDALGVQSVLVQTEKRSSPCAIEVIWPR